MFMASSERAILASETVHIEVATTILNKSECLKHIGSFTISFFQLLFVAHMYQTHACICLGNNAKQVWTL